MKKITLLFFTLVTVVASAQLPVSQTPGKKQAIIEEFTGHTCGYCPDGHKIVDNLITANPGKIFGVNIHAGSYANTSSSYPKDFKTADGTAIAAIPGQSIAGYPAGSVNRVPAAVPQTAGGMAMSRGSFGSACATQYNANSYVNVAAQANIDPNTKVLTVNVEAYYTANGPSANKLTVMLLQDKIMGPQSGGSTYYPAMMVGSNYTHNKALRDVITAGATGEAMTGGTTMGTTFSKTITYTIPATIGNIPTVLADMTVLVFISETEKTILAVTKPPITMGATEVQEFNALVSNLNVFPNPASSNPTVDFSISESNNISVIVTNVVGQTVVTKNLGQLSAGDHTFNLDASNLQNGMYFVKLTNGTDNIVTSVSIEK